jgi:hypothetical protein
MLPIQTVVCVLFQPILINVTSFMDMPYPMRMLYNMFLQLDSRNLCGCMLRRHVLAMLVVVKLNIVNASKPKMHYVYFFQFFSTYMLA